MRNEDLNSPIDHSAEMKKEGSKGNVYLRHTMRDGTKIGDRSSLFDKNIPENESNQQITRPVLEL